MAHSVRKRLGAAAIRAGAEIGRKLLHRKPFINEHLAEPRCPSAFSRSANRKVKQHKNPHNQVRRLHGMSRPYVPGLMISMRLGKFKRPAPLS